MATAKQVDELKKHAVNDVTRAIAKRGIKLSVSQAIYVGDQTIDWMRKRLGLSAKQTDRGVTFKPL